MSRIVSAPVAVTKDLTRQQWRRFALPSALVFVAFVFAMHDTVASLFDLWWRSYSYGHGFVVLAGTAYLLYLHRAAIAAAIPRTSILGLLIACALIGVWFASRILSVLIGEQVALVLIMLALIMALYGPRIAKIAALPLLYLYCAVPIWSYLVPVLQDSTAQVATRMSRALGVPIYLEGIYMTIPDGVFLVAEVCAGVSYLLAALSLGAFYALWNLRGGWTRLGLVVLSFGIGVIFNWIRVTCIVLIGHYSQMQSFLVREHIWFGWVLFILVVLLVMVCGRFLERIEERAERKGGEKAQKKAAFGARETEETRANNRTMWAMAVVCAAVLSVPAYAAMRRAVPPQEVGVVSLPENLGRESGWHIGAAPSDGWSASLKGPDSQARATYRSEQQQVDVQIGYFTVQRPEAEALNGSHKYFDHTKWRPISQKVGLDEVPIKSGFSVNERSIHARNTAERRLVWWWYWVDQQFTANRMQAKLLQIRSVFSGYQPAAIIVMSSPVSGTIGETREFMKNWLRDSAAAMAANLRAASRQGNPS